MTLRNSYRARPSKFPLISATHFSKMENYFFDDRAGSCVYGPDGARNTDNKRYATTTDARHRGTTAGQQRARATGERASARQPQAATATVPRRCECSPSLPLTPTLLLRSALRGRAAPIQAPRLSTSQSVLSRSSECS